MLFSEKRGVRHLVMLSIPVWLLLQTFHQTFGQTGNLQAAKRLSKLSTDCYLAFFPLNCTMHDIVPDHRKGEREMHQTETVKKLQKLALPGTVRSLGVVAEISHCSFNVAKDAGKLACYLLKLPKDMLLITSHNNTTEHLLPVQVLRIQPCAIKLQGCAFG